MIILILIIIIPLISSFLLIREKIEISNKVRDYLTINIWNNLEYFSISGVEVSSIKEDKISLKSTIKIPDSINLSIILSKVNWELSKEFWKTVEIDLEIIRVVSLISN